MNSDASEFFDLILRSARNHDHKTLLKIEADPSTESLLGIMPEGEARQARVHLRNAVLWRARKNEKAGTKLDAAETAIDGLDLQLARGILRKLDPQILAESQLARYDGLLLEVEARAMELEDIEDQIPPPPPEDEPRRGPFWRR